MNNFPQLGLGTFPLKGSCLLNCMQQAIKSGYNLIDTAYKYNNEEEIRDSLQLLNPNEKVIIQSKLSLTQLQRKKFLGITYDRTTPKDALKGSCSRLGVPCIDVYLLHSPNKCVALFGDLIQLRNQGLAKVVGGCRMEIDHLNEIRNLYGEYPAINQLEVHPYYSNRKLVDYCLQNDIVVEARSPFAHGDLMEQFLVEPNLITIARNHGKTIPQIILRWITQQGLTVIVRSSNPLHVKENAEIFDFELSTKEMGMIDALNKDMSMGCLSLNQKH